MLQSSEQTISCWNNYPVTTCYVLRPERHQDLKHIPHNSLIARGLGRSYGDASLNSHHNVLLMQRLNRFLAFNSSTGLLRAETGVSLKDVLDVFVPLGWFPPVTPGTKFVTLGGCVAADVHGKNHHIEGTFGQHVASLEIILANESTRQCSPTNNRELFWATIGGMGLTGIISEVTLQLKRIETSLMNVTHTAAKGLDEALSLLSKTDPLNPYSVAWIDCLATGSKLGRSIVMEAHHASRHEFQGKKNLVVPRSGLLSVPFNLPSWTLNRCSVQLFNSFYYNIQRRGRSYFQTDYDRFFYPLDGIQNWNRIYGHKGFIQYQFVVPTQNASKALKTALDELAHSGRPSFLAVLKRFGPANPGYLSFPFEGYTLAIDLPIKDDGLFPLLDRLDQVILQNEGRIYLAKDARMKPAVFHAMYPRLKEWQQIKTSVDPHNIFSSDLSRRLKMEDSHGG